MKPLELKLKDKVFKIELGEDSLETSGLLIPLLKCIQKHLGHSFSKLKLDGLNLYAIITLRSHLH